MDLEIKTIDWSDRLQRDHLVMLIDQYACDPMGGGEPLSEFARAHLAESLAQRTDSLVLLAYCDDRPAGVLTAFEGFSTFMSKPLLAIHDISVDADFRKRGIATALLGRAETIAKSRGYGKLTLEVLESNQVAQSVYRRFGFAGYELDPEKGRALFWDKKL